MAAGTYISTLSTAATLNREVNAIFSSRESAPGRPGKGGLVGPFTVTAVLPTASVDDNDDKVNLFVFPSSFLLVGMSVNFPDLDTGANLVQSVLAVTVAGGTTQATLISATQAGRTGANDDLDANLDAPIDVGGCYCQLHTTTGAAGGAQGGTITVKFWGFSEAVALDGGTVTIV